MEQVINQVKRINKKSDRRIEMIDAFDKSNWIPVTFGEVCRNINIIDKDPLNNGIERYVGLEHIEPDNLHIKSWGNVSDGTTFTKRFSTGQVLFGKRRAYLRKAAIADFDGVCSGDILVFEANEDAILPELFPFLVQSSRFFDLAIQTSAGSLSPRTKFQDLAKFKFLLPPKEQQVKLAELLWAADNVIANYNTLVHSSSEIKDLLENKYLTTGLYDAKLKNSSLGNIPVKWNCITLQQMLEKEIIVSHLDGNHGGLYPRAEEFVEKGVPYISANCIVKGRVDLSKGKFLSFERAQLFKKGVAMNGDVLLAHNATVGPAALLQTDCNKVILSTTLTYFRVNPLKYNNIFLLYFLRSSMFQRQLEKVMKQSTRNQVPITTQRKLYFLEVPLQEQEYIVKQIMKIDKIIDNARLLTTMSKKMSVRLVDEIFS